LFSNSPASGSVSASGGIIAESLVNIKLKIKEQKSKLRRRLGRRIITGACVFQKSGRDAGLEFFLNQQIPHVRSE